MNPMNNKKILNSTNSNNITSDNNVNLYKNQNKNELDFENILNESLLNINNSDLNLAKNLLDFEIFDSDESISYAINDTQFNDVQNDKNSIDSDFRHLYHLSSSVEGQCVLKLERLKKFNIFLIRKIKFLENENNNLVEKSKEQLSIIREEKSYELQINSMKNQLSNQEDTINGLIAESKIWKDNFLELRTKHQKLVDEQSKEQIEFKTLKENLIVKNQELETDLNKYIDENNELNKENKQLNNLLLQSSSELEKMKKNFNSCESLKKDRLRSQQKYHVISEKLDACKRKLEDSTNMLNLKTCLYDQQNKEIKDLNTTISDLKNLSATNQIELEKHKNRIDEFERKIKDKEELINEYKLLYHDAKNNRENEIRHEQQTIKALIMINSNYEKELATLKADLEQIKYDEMIKKKNIPDLIEDNAERERLNKFKKKYKCDNIDNQDENEIFENETNSKVQENITEIKNKANSKKLTNGNVTKADLNGGIKVLNEAFLSS